MQEELDKKEEEQGYLDTEDEAEREGLKKKLRKNKTIQDELEKKKEEEGGLDLADEKKLEDAKKKLARPMSGRKATEGHDLKKCPIEGCAHKDLISITLNADGCHNMTAMAQHMKSHHSDLPILKQLASLMKGTPKWKDWHEEHWGEDCCLPCKDSKASSSKADPTPEKRSEASSSKAGPKPAKRSKASSSKADPKPMSDDSDDLFEK